MSLSHSLTAVGNSVTHSAVPRSPSSSDSINEPITAGIRRQRTDSAADQDDPTILTPSHTKRLKVYAKKVAEESDISEKDLYDFIDTGGIYYMLINLKSCYGNADQDYEPEDNEGPDTTPYSRALAEDDSGFGDNGKPAIFTSGKFWNFVDTSLENIPKVVKQEAVNNHQGTVFQHTSIENVFWQILVEYFQEDLADFPSNMAIPKLLTNNSPQWQTTIQNNLLWNGDQ